MHFTLTSRDNLLAFEADPADIIRQACEIKNKATDLIDALCDYQDSNLTHGLIEILGFLVDSSQYFADCVSDRIDFKFYIFENLSSCFSHWYSKLDDLTRFHNMSVVLRQQGFYFRSIYFSCRALDEMLSAYFQSWWNLHPEDFTPFEFPPDYVQPDYPFPLPDINFEYPASHPFL